MCGFVVSANLRNTDWPFNRKYSLRKCPQFSANHFHRSCAEKCQNPGWRNSPQRGSGSPPGALSRGGEALGRPSRGTENATTTTTTTTNDDNNDNDNDNDNEIDNDNEVDNDNDIDNDDDDDDDYDDDDDDNTNDHDNHNDGNDNDNDNDNDNNTKQW